MKIKIILFLFVFCSLNFIGFSKNTDPKQEVKKNTKSKYDFNVFKFITIDNHQKSDSTEIPLFKTPLKKED